MATFLFLAAIAAVAYGAWRLSLRRHPYARCLWCRGRSGRNTGSSRRTWGYCKHCGGSGKRLRVGAREP